MAGGMHDAEGALTELDVIAVLEQGIEDRAGRVHVLGVEHRAKGFLDLGDPGTDPDLRAGPVSDIVCRGQVIGMGMGVENPAQADVVGFKTGQEGLDPVGREPGGVGVIVENGVNQDRLGAAGIGDEVGHGLRSVVEEGRDVDHGGSPPDNIFVLTKLASTNIRILCHR